jgi:hypothetical protein
MLTVHCARRTARLWLHLDSDYLSYPTINTPFEMSMHHVIDDTEDDEEHDWKVQVILRVSMEAV